MIIRTLSSAGSVWCCLLVSFVFWQTASAAASCGSCAVPHTYDPDRHQYVYKIGVLNFRGPDSAYAQHNATFAAYLTATVGQRFNPPIRFEMKPLDFQSMFDAAAEGLVDFMYVSPSPFACVEAEYGAQSLVSHISKRKVGGNTYTLEKFAGVIAARADNEEVNSLADLKGRVVASAAISSFGGGQMQFREVQNAGMSYINDPKQVVFTGNQGQIVNGVLSGKFDIGFIRTDQIQRTKDENGELVDPNLLKVLEPKPNMLDGAPFPFIASTQLYPEWNLAAMNFVASDVAREVQSAMLSLAEHAEAGDAIQSCLDANLTIATCNNLDEIMPDARCDTTVEIAAIANQAMQNGGYAGFRTTQSYIEIRAMLQDTGFIQKDEETNVWRCARPADLYKAIVCPPGHFKKKQEDVESGCAQAGLECSESHQCVCNPCQKAFDVDIFPAQGSDNNASTTGCPKMSLCGGMEQRELVTFRAIDNKKRAGAVMNVTVREGSLQPKLIPVQGDPFTNEYSFSIAAQRVGILIMEVYVDGQQVPESPLRVQVSERQCDDQLREADDVGECVCKGGNVTIGDHCLPLGVLFVIILAPLVLIGLVFVYRYVEKKKREADLVWSVKKEDIHFDNPPTIIGQGSFGYVLLAEYRGTSVAVKRAYESHKKRGPTGIFVLHDEDSSENNTSKTRSSGAQSGTFQNKLATIQSQAELDTSHQDDDHFTDDLVDVEEQVPRSSLHSLSQEELKSGTKTIMRSGRLSGTRSSKRVSGKRFSFAGIGFGRGQKEEFIEEMRLLSKLRHPCITTVMGAVMEPHQEPMLIMEYCCHGSLHDLLHNETMVIEGDLVLNILQDIAQGVRFLHSAKPAVIHGDLKSANVLIDGRFRAKVADFGLAQDSCAHGTPYWMAPELLRGESLNTVESDMYAIGVILYELYMRKDPYWDCEDPDEVLNLVCDKNINKRPPIPKACPPVVAKVMKSLLSGTPTARPIASDLDTRFKDLDANAVAPQQLSNSRRRIIQPSTNAADKNDILYKVFPRHIADVLASGGKPEPESHEIVTIFFSDSKSELVLTFPPCCIIALVSKSHVSFFLPASCWFHKHFSFLPTHQSIPDAGSSVFGI